SQGSLNVRFTPDCVAKLFAALQKSNYRIRLNAILNRCCAPVLLFESILPNLVAKIVLQHNPPQSGQIADISVNVRFVPRAAASTRSKRTYSITSSARATNLSGAWRPNILAILPLITSWKFISLPARVPPSIGARFPWRTQP